MSVERDTIKVRPIYAQILIEQLLAALEQQQHEIDVIKQELVATQNKMTPSQIQDELPDENWDTEKR